jgi:hypothetical protein
MPTLPPLLHRNDRLPHASKNSSHHDRRNARIAGAVGWIARYYFVNRCAIWQYLRGSVRLPIAPMADAVGFLLSPASRAHAGPLCRLSAQSVRICYFKIQVKDASTMFPVTFLSHTHPLMIGAAFPQ